MRQVKVYASESAALAQHAAVNQALGLPRKGRNVGKGPHARIPETPTDDDYMGWSLETAQLIDGPGPTVGLDVSDAAIDALHGRAVDVPGRGVVTIDVRPVRDMRQDEAHRPARVPR